MRYLFFWFKLAAHLDSSTGVACSGCTSAGTADACTLRLDAATGNAAFCLSKGERPRPVLFW